MVARLCDKYMYIIFASCVNIIVIYQMYSEI